MKFLCRLFFCFCSLALLYSCSSNNVHVRNEWKKYFTDNGIDGNFMLHNATLNTFEVYDLPGTQNRFMPAATFDVMNAMTGLETGIISDTNMVIRDSLEQPVPGVDPHLTMGQAFRRSSFPYFSRVARRIGRVKMQFWLDSLKYGNTTIGAAIDSFWLDNTLKISADEQLGLIQQMYYGKLPFQSRTQRLVKNLMTRQKTLRYTLAYKSGAGFADGKHIGWIIGWVEKKGRPHFFVLQTEAPAAAKNLNSTDFKILHDILDEEGFFKEEK